MKKLLFVLAMLSLCVVLCVSAFAAEKTVYVAAGGDDANNGDSYQNAVKTVAKAYQIIGDNDGKIVLCSYVNVGSNYVLPKHSGTVTFTASDTNYQRLYYKMPDYTYYYSTTATSYTTSTATGWWTVYAVDSVGNKTNEFTFYYDATKPTGSISSNGTSVASGSYVNKSFAYTASDTGSGIKQIYYKSPISGSYQTYASGTIIPATAGDGWYYFYSVDNAGNQSSTMSVYLETEAPLKTL